MLRFAKKNQSNLSYETQTTIKRNSKSNPLETKFSFVKTMFKLINWKEGFETKILALVSLDSIKKLRGFEDQGLICDKNIHG